jgi:Protein of unknown function (DUF2934)
MAKKQTIASEIGSALGAAAARAEQLIAGNPTKPTAKPVAKRTAAAKHSTTTAKKTAKAATPEVIEEALVVISHEAIAEQAYLYWEARGCQGGDPASDWARAEEELKQRVMTASA